MQKLKNIRAVIFDCDGVIVNSAADIADAVNAALCKNGFSPLEQKTLCEFVGNGASVLVERAVKTAGGVSLDAALPVSQNEFQKIQKDYLDFYFENAVVKTSLYPGFEKMISKLNDEKILLGIVTNKPQKILEKILRHFKIENFFCSIVCPEKVANLKPAPDGIFFALKEMNESLAKKSTASQSCKTAANLKSANSKNREKDATEKMPCEDAATKKNCEPELQKILPCHAVMVGDSYTDIAAGNAAGVWTAACLNGMGCKEKMLSQKPSVVLEYAAEIADCVL